MNEQKKGTSSTEGMKRSVETSDLLKVNNEGHLPQIKGINIKWIQGDVLIPDNF